MMLLYKNFDCAETFLFLVGFVDSLLRVFASGVDGGECIGDMSRLFCKYW